MIEQTTPKERSDITATLITMGLVAVAVGSATVLRALAMFTPDGIALTVPFRGETVELIPKVFPPDPALPATTVRVMTGEIVAHDVNVLSHASLIAALVISALAWITVIGIVGALALRFLRGRFFDADNPRLLDFAARVMLGGTLAVLALETLGRNGVLAAAGLGNYDIDTWAVIAPFVSSWITAVILGLIAMAFRRGILLQRETEGLV